MAQIDALKVGGLVAYGSYDDDAYAADSLESCTLVALYADYAVSEKLTLGVYGGYADSNVDDPTSNYDGASMWEVNGHGSYAVTDNLTYSFGAAVGQLEFGSVGTYDPDKAVEVYHELAFSF